jgi:hypothetical protein
MGGLKGNKRQKHTAIALVGDRFFSALPEEEKRAIGEGSL